MTRDRHGGTARPLSPLLAVVGIATIADPLRGTLEPMRIREPTEEEIRFDRR